MTDKKIIELFVTPTPKKVTIKNTIFISDNVKYSL